MKCDRCGGDARDGVAAHWIAANLLDAEYQPETYHQYKTKYGDLLPIEARLCRQCYRLERLEVRAVRTRRLRKVLTMGGGAVVSGILLLLLPGVGLTRGIGWVLILVGGAALFFCSDDLVFLYFYPRPGTPVEAIRLLTRFLEQKVKASGRGTHFWPEQLSATTLASLGLSDLSHEGRLGPDQ